MAGMATGIVGGLIVNALIPPPRLANTSGNSKTDPTTQFVTGARNQLVLYGSIPSLLGFTKVVPNKMARDFTEVRAGIDQYVRCLFGQRAFIEISQEKVGQTDLGQFEGVQSGYRNLVRAGVTYGDDPLAIYSTNVHEETPSVELRHEDDPGVTRTSQLGARALSVDFTCPKGLFAMDIKNGNTLVIECTVRIEYRVKGEENWTWLKDSRWTAGYKSAVRWNETWEVPDPLVQYDVRCWKVTVTTGNAQDVHEVWWTALRTLKSSLPLTYPELLSQIEVCIKASGQLNGTLDEYNFLGKSIWPDWDRATQTWITRTTQNPAALFRAVLQGAAAPESLADSRVNLAQLQAWHEDCADRGYAYNRNIDTAMPWWDLLTEIAAAGRAYPCEYDGKWSVILEEAQELPVDAPNPRVIRDLEVELLYPDLPHAFRCPFKNELADWQDDERLVLADGYQADGLDAFGRAAPELPPAIKFEQLVLPGVTHPEQIWKLARFHLAQARLRWRNIRWSTNVQNFVCTRGDKFLLAHDVLLVGLAYGRIRTLNYEILGYEDGEPVYGDNLIGVTLDEAVTMEAGRDYGLQFRLPNQHHFSCQLVTTPGESRLVEFAELITPEDDPYIPGAGDLVTFGERGQETIPVIITGIERQKDLWARITAVDEAPELHLADQGIIPEHVFRGTLPAGLRPPEVISIRSDYDAMLLTANGWQPRILVAFVHPSNPYGEIVAVEAQYWVTGTDGPRAPVVAPIDSGELSLMPVETGRSYDFRLRYNRQRVAGLPGTWSDIYRHTVVGLAAIPDITGLTTFYRAGQTWLKWAALSHNYPGLDYEVRRGDTWATAEVLGWTTLTEIAAQGDGTYWLAARLGQLYSPTPVSVVIEGASLTANILVTHDEYADEWPGTLSGGAYVDDDGFLRMGSSMLFEDMPGNFDAAVGLFDDQGVLAAAEYYEVGSEHIVDLGVVQPCGLSFALASAILDPGNLFDMQSGYFDLTPGNFDGPVSGQAMVQAQVALAQADGVFGEWQEFIPGQYVARKFWPRLVLQSQDGHTTPLVTGFSWTVDMPDRLDSYEVDCLAIGVTLTFTQPFQAAPKVGASIINAEAGDQLIIGTPTAAAVALQVLNGGSGAHRTLHVFPKGY